MPELTESEAESIFDWQQRRRRAGAVHVQPLSGFGPRGEYSLWVAPPATGGRHVFRNGKPTYEESPSALSDPELERLRDEILATAVRRGPMQFTVSIAFLAYASRLLCNSYELSDADLEMLLSTGDQWQSAVVQHLLGGDGLVAKLVELYPQVSALPAPAPIPIVATPPRRPNRLLERIRGAFARHPR